MTQITIYTLSLCPLCDQVKSYLKLKNKQFNEMSMLSAEGMTELKVNQVFTINAPVLQIGTHFYYDKSFEEFVTEIERDV